MEESLSPVSGPQKLFLGLTFALGLGLCGAAAWVKLQPHTERVSGYIVAKEWEKRHMSNVEAPRVQEASLLSVIFVPGSYTASTPHLVPSSFTIWVADREAVRSIAVDSAQWGKLHCGQPFSYTYTH